MRVAVHRNLHTGGYSVVAREGDEYGRVIDHVDTYHLRDVSLDVQPGGRKRVLRDKRKNVHAFVVGERIEASMAPTGGWVEATYNPYKYDSFVILPDEEPRVAATYARFTPDGMFLILG